MATATLTAPASRNPLTAVLAFFSLFRRAQRFEYLFSLNDAQLKARGLDREMLARHYISGLTTN
ncbi:hypothetical protein AIOL_002512 [Candidatus Rhodobacter oscarellae]|uniref:DUF1127 domain-containing protein n=1 Tax=Candidatus Rhodobacter oscarellae TaxID=1675527 RepID=A0A0J9E494_9RHOB|nr:hypothetical protein [Candidatus Rhodobacter lobularis]KMW57547.1 hypothetical protein AIOL_002512 [Candidatus Rhodobacter lobularis]